MLLSLLLLAQSPALSPCSDPAMGPRAECGSIEVWENRAAKTGRKISIYFAVLRADRPSTKEPVFAFAGGPGEPSTAMAPRFNGPLAPVRQTRDVVLVDQRGTGHSNILDCPTGLAADPKAAFGHVFAPAHYRACLAELGKRADLRLYTTELAAADIDDVRAALGYQRIIVTGGSYGTRLSQAYMRAYPSRVVAAVLDGVVPFDLHIPSGYAVDAQRSLDRIFDDCLAAPSCARQTPNVRQEFDRLVARLQQAPVATTIRGRDGGEIGVPFSMGDFAYALRGILYSTQRSRLLPALIHEADSTGNLGRFAQTYWQRAVGFDDSGLGLHLAILCSEDVPFVAPNDPTALGPGTFMGRYLNDEYRNACALFPRSTLGAHATDPVTLRIPTLLLSGWFDPVTPPEAGERVAAKLPLSRHIVVRNTGHGSGYGCALPATLYVLIEGKLEGMPAVCERVKNLYEP